MGLARCEPHNDDDNAAQHSAENDHTTMGNPFMYGFFPGGFAAGQGYVGEGDAPNIAKLIAAGQLHPAQLAAHAQLAAGQVNPAALVAAQQQFNPAALAMPGSPAHMMAAGGLPVHPAALARFGLGGWPVANVSTGPFDPRQFTQELPKRMSPMVLGLGQKTIAAGATETITAQVQRSIAFRKVMLFGLGATDLQSAIIQQFTCNGDNLTAGGGSFPASSYDKRDEWDNISTQLYTSGAVVNLVVTNIGAAPITIFGSIRGETAT